MLCPINHTFLLLLEIKSYNLLTVHMYHCIILTDLVEKLSDTVRYLSNGGLPAPKPKAKTTFLDADDDRSEALSVHELVSLLMLYF